MALSPVERLNVFDPDLRAELRSNSFSKDLVRIRAPFLRFTTATDMSDVETTQFLGSEFSRYRDCKFFTLGLHGWDNKDYSAADLYGAQGDKGLVVGTTYKQNTKKQILMHTHGSGESVTSGVTTSTGARSTATISPTIISVAEGANNYPPPGITSAKVERVRSGNVLKIQLEIQCHTQEQLQVLDSVCFIPGMTCILEWGTLYTTPTGISELNTLDFKDERIIEEINNAKKLSRSRFIEKWCKPNKFNYDWAVANIANVKTVLQNNTYNISVTAYGMADNIMYISAYATSNPLEQSDVDAEKALIRSVAEYFRLNGPFSTHLKDNVDNTRGNIIKFYDEVNRAEQPDSVPASTDSGTSNDLGLEDSYFINFAYFVDSILNTQIMEIVRQATGNQVMNRLLTPVVDGADIIPVGYNECLRSTNPETMIIYNPRAVEKAKNRKTTGAQQAGLIGQVAANSRVDVTTISATSTNTQGQTAFSAMQSKPFGSEVNQVNVSGLTNLASGVWLNSKAIQAAFLNARTIMEGIETLLRNINAATENYWDFKLFWDEEKQEFRILDDNARDTEINNTNTKIYEFNKRLKTTDSDTIGPDVLDIQISTDYPKMLFSQLAVSGINGGNLANLPQRKDADFLNRKLKDIFAKKSPTARGRAGSSAPTYPPGGPALLVTEISKNLATEIGGDNGDIANLLAPFSTGAAPGVPREVANFITTIFKNKDLLEPGIARDYRSQFEKFRKDSLITAEQAASIATLFAYRTKAIITNLKSREKQRALDSVIAYNNANENALFGKVLGVNVGPGLSRLDNAVMNKVDESKNKLIKVIDDAVAGQRQLIDAANTAARAAERATAVARGDFRAGGR